MEIEQHVRGEGLGKELYRLVSSLPLANGRSAKQDELTFTSGKLNKKSRAVWESLVRAGDAKVSNGWAVGPFKRYDYEMIK